MGGDAGLPQTADVPLSPLGQGTLASWGLLSQALAECVANKFQALNQVVP